MEPLQERGRSPSASGPGGHLGRFEGTFYLRIDSMPSSMHSRGLRGSSTARGCIEDVLLNGRETGESGKVGTLDRRVVAEGTRARVRSTKP